MVQSSPCMLFWQPCGFSLCVSLRIHFVGSRKCFRCVLGETSNTSGILCHQSWGMMKKLSRMVFTGWSFGEDLWIYLVLTAGHVFAFLLCALELVWHLYVPPDLSWPIISALWCCYKAMNSQLAQPSGFRSQKIHTVNNVYTPCSLFCSCGSI